MTISNPSLKAVHYDLSFVRKAVEYDSTERLPNGVWATLRIIAAITIGLGFRWPRSSVSPNHSEAAC